MRGCVLLLVALLAIGVHAQDPCDDATSYWGPDQAGSTVGRPNVAGNPAGDALITFVLSEPGQLVQIHLCSPLTDFPAMIRLYDRCPANFGAVELAASQPWPECGREGAPEEPARLTRADLPALHTYWVLVEGEGVAEGQFGLTIDCHSVLECASVSETEPNDQPGEADSLSIVEELDVGQTRRWWSGDSLTGDADWYAVSLALPATIELWQSGGEHHARLALCDTLGAVLAAGDCTSYGSHLLSPCLLPGSYWVRLEPGEGLPPGIETCYELGNQLHPCEIDPCEHPWPLACGDTLQASSAMSWMGNLFGVWCGEPGLDGPEVLFRLEHPGGWLRLDLQSPQADAQGDDLVLALGWQCGPEFCQDLADQPGSTEHLLFREALPAGSYWVSVDARSWSGLPYPFELLATCGFSACPPPVCPQGATWEVEPNGGFEEESAWNPLFPGLTVCGEVRHDSLGGNPFRLDRDGFLFELTAATRVRLELEGEAGRGLDLSLVAVEEEGETPVQPSPQQLDNCSRHLADLRLPAGTYAAVVGAAPGDALPTAYWLAWTTPACAGTMEGEPNGGPDDSPPAFGSLACPDTLCGTLDVGDEDWFLLALTADAALEFEGIPDGVDLALALFAAGSTTPLATADLEGTQGVEVLDSGCLPVGEYWLRVAAVAAVEPGAWELRVAGVPCQWVDPVAACQPFNLEPGPEAFLPTEAGSQQADWLVAERFGHAGEIWAISWTGALADIDGGMPAWCDEQPVPFHVQIRADGDEPGGVLAQWSDTLTGEPTGETYFFLEVRTWTLSLTASLPVTSGYLVVQGAGDPGCTFGWGRMNQRDNRHWRQVEGEWVEEDGDLAFCLDLVPPCQRPDDVSITSTGSVVRLSWTSVADAVDYQVWRTPDPAGGWHLVGPTTGGQSSWEEPLPGLALAFYQVRAVCP